MDLDSYRQKIASALKTLEAALGGLANALAHSDADVDVAFFDHRSAIAQVCAAYTAIDYGIVDDLGASVVCLGVVGVNSEILRRAAAVNALKAEFKALCTPLHGIQVRIPVKGEATPTRKISAMRLILRNIQRSDLNLLAAYRKIPLLKAPPEKITYTRAYTRAVYRKSLEELFILLNDLEGATASHDRARLQTLDRNETHLALVKERYQNVRANILYARLDPRGRGRVQIAAELPLMYPRAGNRPPPQVQFPLSADLPGKVRRVREAKLEALPFLKSLPVYRYCR